LISIGDFMFSFWRSKQESSSNNEKPSPKAPFTTQADILEQVGRPNGPGICAATANLYTQEQMGLKPQGSLTGTPHEIYAAVVNEQREEVMQECRGKPGFLNAFYKSGEPIKKHYVPTPVLQSPELCEGLYGDKDHVIANVPTTDKTSDGSRISHLVSWGKVKEDDPTAPRRCYFFDANQPGGSFVGDCKSVYTRVSQQLSKEYIASLAVSTVASIGNTNS
jgi:hypothetical protein